MLLTFLCIDDDPPPLASDEVHIWTVPLDHACDESLMTADERERAGRFKMERVRRQFVASRCHLREILAHYLSSAAPRISILTEPGGKPYLDPVLNAGLHFNVSHSEGLAVYAVTGTGRVGIDVELWRDIPNAESLVERFFSRRENEQFLAIPEGERLAAFFRAWTRKEAVLKAIGRGVQALDQCEVTFAPGESEKVLRMGDDLDAAKKWLLKSWHPEGNYVAAVAVELG